MEEQLAERKGPGNDLAEQHCATTSVEDRIDRIKGGAIGTISERRR